MDDWFCKNCVFWVPSEKYPTYTSMGYCRRYPPVPVLVETGLQYRFPSVADYMQCGEWRKKDMRER